MAYFRDRKNIDNYWTGTKREDDMRGGGGEDIIYGLGGNDRIFGGTEDDFIYGGDGDDYIRGDQGADTLEGGAGSDTFEYLSTADSNLTDGVDTITDFNPNEDFLELRLLTFVEGPDTSRPIYLVDSPTGERDEITLTPSGDITVLNFYYAGDSVADLTIYLAGAITTSAGMNGVVDG